jgi:putative membrane-bound dehydrogenase-like protein
MPQPLLIARLIAFLSACSLAAQAPGEAARKPEGTTAPQSPQAQLASFALPPGYRAQLVAAEPLLCEPVLCTFDGDGRLYVAEMTTYMQDIDGTGEDEPKGRISVLFDDDGDGRMDRRTTFADGLVLPRLLLPLDDGVLVGETYTTALWLYRDADRDGVAESKERLREGKRDGRNLEHQDSALTWGIDNWLYTAMSGERLRLRGNELTSEPVSSEFAQWGLAVDDLGRQFFASAGGERPAYGFQRHPRYGRAGFDGELAPGFTTVYPAVATPDVQGGAGRIGDDGALNHMTGCCGQSIYRGDLLPDCRGDYFVCEPVGRLVRRAKVRDAGGKLVLDNAHPGAEFMTSTDMNFRPVWSTTGPDGALWLVDMYRGIIQEGNWVKDGSYLRPVVARLGLDANVARGRIWRIVGAREAAPAPARLRAPVAELIADLRHENGWRRDNAQKLLVRRGDASAVPGVRALLIDAAAPPLGRVHALWTLEGLDALTRDDVLGALRDRDPGVRGAAIRASETLLRAGDARVRGALLGLVRDPDVQVAIQLALSLRFSAESSVKEAILALLGQHPQNEVVAAACRDSLRGEASDAPVADLDAAGLALVQEGKTHYLQLCVACHGVDGKGAKVSGLDLGPPLVGSPRVRGSAGAMLRIVLHGLTGPVDGKVWGGGVMAPQGAQDDRYLAAVASYVRTVFGEFAGIVAPDQVAAVRAATKGRTAMWTLAELAPHLELPRAVVAQFTPSASHGADPKAALDGDAKSRFSTDTPMQPGMWWQVDLGADFALTELALDAGASSNDFPRGYRVDTSLDGATWQEAAQGEGQRARVVIPLAVARARHLRVEQTGTSEQWYWSIHEAAFCGQRLR